MRLEGRDVILTGRGDARLSSAADCVVNCLSQLADAIAARTKRVRHIVGDATQFPDERWSSGMSWNNIPYRYGTAISALSLDDNELVLTVTPGPVGQPPVVRQDGYVVIDNRATTAQGARTDIGHDRLPLERVVRVTGTIDAGAGVRTIRTAIDDPAHYAAWRLATLLRERGVRVSGRIESRYRPPLTPPAAEPAPAPLAALTPPPLLDDLRIINKDSQNLHAELLIRRVGLTGGLIGSEGGVADGQKQVEAMFTAAGVDRTAFDFSDGSGMSTYNRISPRGMVRLLNWITAQPWGGAFRDTLPIGGVDGTLSRRFKGTPLEGRIFAKTGSINATSALAGYLIANSGRTLTFAIYANDMPSGTTATPVMDAALLAVAQAN